MDVRDFVKETILQVMGGVQDAQQVWRSGDNKGHINPVWGSPSKEHLQNVREITFDIAVTASGDSAVSGGAGLKVVGFGDFGGKAERRDSVEQVSRISFSVPVLPPVIFIENSAGA
jgi:hypothetical protein